jgi:hypothetical protein
MSSELIKRLGNIAMRRILSRTLSLTHHRIKDEKCSHISSPEAIITTGLIMKNKLRFEKDASQQIFLCKEKPIAGRTVTLTFLIINKSNCNELINNELLKIVTVL